MPQLRRPLSALALGAASALASVLLVASPAQAANIDFTLDGGEVSYLSATYETASGFTIGTSTTSLHVTAMPEILETSAQNLGYELTNLTTTITGSLGAPSADFSIPVPSGFVQAATSSLLYLSIFESLPNGSHLPIGQASHIGIDVTLIPSGTGSGTVELALTKANATSSGLQAPEAAFTVHRAYPQGQARLNWGDTLTFHAPAGFWTVGDNWAQTRLRATLTSADIGMLDNGTQVGSQVSVTGLTASPAGDSLVLQLPASAPANVNWSTGTTLSVSVSQIYDGGFGGVTSGSSYTVTLDPNFFPTSRLAGYNRFSTAATVSAQFATADTAYIANGLNYPDALSAAPAAAHANGPLLLVEQGSLPQQTKDELLRLQPARIIIAGGTAAVSNTVQSQLEALYPGTQVERFAGANRYETSRLISADAFPAGGTSNAFVATGLNFPDALAASAAAAHLDAPVILVDGGAATVDSATRTLLATLGTDDVFIAGGTAVVSTGIQNQLGDLYSVTRLAGAGRYETAVAINDGTFTGGSTKAYLAVGTGYADALAGAALAGSNDAPLFTVPGDCVPQGVLDSLGHLGATDVTLFGGTAVLSLNVAKLQHC